MPAIASRCQQQDQRRLGRLRPGTRRSGLSGAIALVSAGCGADANPSSGVTGDKVDVARGQGAEIAGEVRRLLESFLAPVHGKIAAGTRMLELPLAKLPTRGQWQEQAKKDGAVGYHARVNLARLDRGENLRAKIDYPVQTWTFGNSLAMVFLPGEVVVDYSLRLKKELDAHRLWINAYANDAPCYIPSERVLKEGGYEGGGANDLLRRAGAARGRSRTEIVGAVRELVGPSSTRRLTSTMPDAAAVAAAVVGRDSDQAQSQGRAGRRRTAGHRSGRDRLWSGRQALGRGDVRLSQRRALTLPSPPGGEGKRLPGGRIRLLECTRGDTRFDKATVFLDNIPFPTGVTAWGKGVLVCAAPDILYAEDTDGDGKADVVRKLFSGFGTDNYQARVNSLEYGLDGWLYGSCRPVRREDYLPTADPVAGLEGNRGGAGRPRFSHQTGDGRAASRDRTHPARPRPRRLGQLVRLRQQQPVPALSAGGSLPAPQSARAFASERRECAGRRRPEPALSLHDKLQLFKLSGPPGEPRRRAASVFTATIAGAGVPGERFRL